MTRQVLIVATIAGVLCSTQTRSAYSRAGKLDRPGIAIPSNDGQLDATGTAINKVLSAHEKQFAGGHYINAHSVLQFNGGIRTINALLADLSKVNGSVLHVRFAKEPGLDGVWKLTDGQPLPKPCDCEISHNGWGDPALLAITIYLGGEDLELDGLVIPVIRGHAERDAKN